jgi:Icc protein
MYLAQISDMHFRSFGRKLYDFIDVNTCNAEVINQLNALEEQPDAVVVTGDIVNCGLAQEYLVARQTLGYLRYPLYVVPGNHDNKQEFLRAFSSLCPLLGDDAENIRYSVDHFPMRLLFIDSSLNGETKGWLSEETLHWLEQQLISAGHKPVAVFMHHPPLKLGSAQMDAIACENGDRLLALIERFPCLQRVFCGHTHRLIFTHYHQAVISTIPGTVHQVPYLHNNPAPFYNLEPAACVMHRWVEPTGLVSYLHPLSHYPGPYLYDPTISCPVDEYSVTSGK